MEIVSMTDMYIHTVFIRLNVEMALLKMFFNAAQPATLCKLKCSTKGLV